MCDENGEQQCEQTQWEGGAVTQPPIDQMA